MPARATRFAAVLIALGLSLLGVAAATSAEPATGSSMALSAAPALESSGALSAAPAAGSSVAVSASLPTGVANRLALRNAMGKLWEDHITWTRLYIVDALADLPDLQPTTQRLLQNQVDIGDAIKPYYGDAAGEQLTALLNQHILIAADVVAAARKNDAPALTSAMARWQDNANDIADFLSAANPDNWPQDELRAMMRQHLDLTTAEVVARLHQDWSADVQAYDQVHEHILMLADALTDGIAAQFPDQFAA